MAHPQHVASQFGPLADDFFISIAFLRGSDPDNLSLPFLHAHVLELSAKAVCHKLGVDIENVSHDVLKIYALLRPHLPDIATLIPTPVHLDAYKKTWVREDAAHRGVELPLRTNERLTLEPQQRVEVRLGSIEERDELAARELAYFVTNVKDLKYGFTSPKKNLLQLSVAHVAFKEGMNHRFLALFRACRDASADADMNRRLKEKFSRVFGATAETEQRLREYLGI